jgi:hypothetical protein
MTQGQTRFEFLNAFMPSIRMALFSAFWLSAGTVKADETTETLESIYNFDVVVNRILNGPSALSLLDKLLYFGILALLFEVLNYVAVNLGGRYKHSIETGSEAISTLEPHSVAGLLTLPSSFSLLRIDWVHARHLPVCGKHLDVLTKVR